MVYGVDVKITPSVDANRFRPVSIEINGIDFGTDFFKYDSGLDYYTRFMQIVGTSVKGKPIFIQDGSYSNDIILAADEKRKAIEKHDCDRELFNFYEKEFGDMFNIDLSWMDDSLNYSLATAHNASEDESKYYYAAGILLGLPVYIYSDITFIGNTAEFILENGKNYRIKVDDIGVIWASSDNLQSAPYQYVHHFLGNPITETITASKSLTKMVFEDSTLDLFPISMSAGLGIGSLAELTEFLQNLDSRYIVKKYDKGSLGIGTEILETEGVINALRKKKEGTFDLKSYFTAMQHIISNVSLGLELEKAVNIYEQFVESIPIQNPATGQIHDGCARVVVYSPDEGDKTVIGSQWRLAPVPLTATSCLNDRLRVNLSRGATAHPIEPAHIKAIEDHAKKTIIEFENNIDPLYNDAKSLHASDLELSETNAARLLLWGNSLEKTMIKKGVFHKLAEFDLGAESGSFEYNELKRKWEDHLRLIALRHGDYLWSP